MAEGEDAKIFQVLDEKSGRKCRLHLKDYSAFEKKCKQKFRYARDEAVVFVLEDEQDIEIDESAFACCVDGTQFRMRPIDSGLTDNSEIVDNEENYDGTKQRKDSNEDMKNKEKYDELYVSASSPDRKESTENSENSSDECWCSPAVENITSGADYIREEMEKRGKDMGKLVEILQEAKNLPLAPLNICVTGRSGQGKSKLINSLRSLKPKDDEYAPVGTTETTDKCTGYPHPYYKNIIYWDVPGLGTKRFPREEYLLQIDFEKYDFFLICSDTRFTEDDAWLAKQVNKETKRFYFLRTKVDKDIDSAHTESHDNFDEKVELDKIRQYCLENVGQDIPVFLISSHQMTKYDFPSLVKKLKDDAPAEQQRSLTFGLVSVSEDTIESKANYLKADIWKTALLSGVGGAVLIPEVSACIDVGLIVKQLIEYIRVFELTPYHIKTYADMISLHEIDFTKDVGLKIDFGSISAQDVKAALISVSMETIGEETSKYFPIIGTMVTAGSSYYTTGKFLQKCLEEIKNTAKKIHGSVARQQANRHKVGSACE